MSAFFKCDMCGKEQKVVVLEKPADWYEREAPQGTEHVCSIECAQALNEKTNTESLLLG